MRLRVVRTLVGLLLVASGALMYAASWQRWAGACAWGQDDGGRCAPLQDHRYDFVLPRAPWDPVGIAAELAGWSLLVLAVTLVALPLALTGRRPHLVSALAWVGTALACADVGAATLRAGLTGATVPTVAGGLTGSVWFFALPSLLVLAAVHSRGWSRTAAVLLVLGCPLVAVFSYAIGPFDAEPWWEAVSGGFTTAAGSCLLAAAALPVRARRVEASDTPAVAAGAGGA
jgi:peptidoglycan/LPS O-acetylase OafA/YrhL